MTFRLLCAAGEEQVGGREIWIYLALPEVLRAVLVSVTLAF